MTYRNKRLLEACRELPCQICGKQDGTVVAAHSNQLRHGKGRGLKAPDYAVASLCFTCHMEIDSGKAMDKETRRNLWNEAHISTMHMLWEMGVIKT